MTAKSKKAREGGPPARDHDAKWLAYVTYPEGILWRSRVDGSQKLQLTSKVPSSASLARWSPDGKHIVFSGADPGHTARLYLTSADGGTPRMLSVGEFNALCPTWMPDGNSIVFMDAGGGHSIKVVNTTTLQVTVIPDSNDLFMPVTSPNGRYIVGPSVNGRKLLLYDFGSRKLSELLNMNIGSTNWSQDSKYIYFDTGLSENPAIYRLRLADKKLERLADLKGFRRVVFGWLPWSGITPDGAPLLLRDISSQEVYALDFDTPSVRSLSKGRCRCVGNYRRLQSESRNVCLGCPIQSRFVRLSGVAMLPAIFVFR